MKDASDMPPDRWGLDPGVQQMRKVFRLLEKRQWDLLARRRIPEFDPRLAPARREACLLLEKGWALAADQGLDLSAEDLGLLYEHLLADLLARQGIMPAPDERTGPWGSLLRRLLPREG